MQLARTLQLLMAMNTDADCSKSKDIAVGNVGKHSTCNNCNKGNGALLLVMQLFSHIFTKTLLTTSCNYHTTNVA